MNIMARNKKNVLNQSVRESVIKEEPKKVVSEGLVYGEDYVEDPNIERKLVEKSPASVIGEISLKDSMEKVVEEISLKDSGEKLAEVIKEKEVKPVVKEVVENPVVEGIVIIKPSKEQLLTLSKAGYRWYQRTGMMPK